MNITKQRLNQIIQEEYERMLDEAYPKDPEDATAGESGDYTSDELKNFMIDPAGAAARGQQMNRAVRQVDDFYRTDGGSDVQGVTKATQVKPTGTAA